MAYLWLISASVSNTSKSFLRHSSNDLVYCNSSVVGGVVDNGGVSPG